MRKSRARRGLTTAQQAAHDKAYAACDHVIEGRFTKGDVVCDSQGQAWKITTYGMRYHEDVSNCQYGVRPHRGPKGWKETVALREAIDKIKRDGIQQPGSRGCDGENKPQPLPTDVSLKTWHDHHSYAPLATFPSVTVYDGGVIGVCCPIYDDSPVKAWVRDEKLAARLLAAMDKYPKVVDLPQVTVRERMIRIGNDHDRFNEFFKASRATPFGDDSIRIPRSEHRRLSAIDV